MTKPAEVFISQDNSDISGLSGSEASSESITPYQSSLLEKQDKGSTRYFDYKKGTNPINI